MNPVFKLYLKEFVRAGSIFSFAFLLEDLIFVGTIDYLFVGISFVFFGSLWSIAGVSIHIERIKSLDVIELTDDILRSKQIRTITTDLNQVELINELLNDPIFGKMAISKKDDKIKLISGITWDSWGVVSTIENIKQIDKQNTYKITSRPRVYIGQPDFGRSLEYITRFEKLVGNVSSIVIA